MCSGPLQIVAAEICLFPCITHPFPGKDWTTIWSRGEAIHGLWTMGTRNMLAAQVSSRNYMITNKSVFRKYYSSVGVQTTYMYILVQASPRPDWTLVILWNWLDMLLLSLWCEMASRLTI